MEFDTVLLPSRRAASLAAGLWHERTINDDLDACVARPNRRRSLSPLHSGWGRQSPTESLRNAARQRTDGTAAGLPRSSARQASR